MRRRFWPVPIMGFFTGPELFPIDKTCAQIRTIQFGGLTSRKQDAKGEENFLVRQRTLAPYTQGGVLERKVWEKNRTQFPEIRNTLLESPWGYRQGDDRQHQGWKAFGYAQSIRGNVLLSHGLSPDGSSHSEEAATMRDAAAARHNTRSRGENDALHSCFARFLDCRFHQHG